MSSIFTKIIRGEIPCHKLYEDEDFFCFLDIRPINPGHALLIPKPEIDYLFEVPDALLSKLLTTAKPIAAAIEAEVSCQRIGLMVAGLEVPHCHLHLVPIQDVHDLSFANAKDADADELRTLATRIQARLSS